MDDGDIKKTQLTVIRTMHRVCVECPRYQQTFRGKQGPYKNVGERQFIIRECCCTRSIILLRVRLLVPLLKYQATIPGTRKHIVVLQYIITRSLSVYQYSSASSVLCTIHCIYSLQYRSTWHQIINSTASCGGCWHLEVPEFLLNRVLEYRTPYRVGRLCQCIPKMSHYEIK
jgi:hypothetical protein